MKNQYVEVLNQLELEDYIALKTKAYDLYSEYYTESGIEFKIINEILQNTFGYTGKEPEAILISSTLLLPDDQKFIDLYKENGYDLQKVKKYYSIVDSKNLLIKEYEVNRFGLDKLIETGLLTPISSDKIVPNGPKK